ncbi:hypothetical protein [Marinisporobacter balticus]|uniref:Spore coat protein GerQ n=1 Tax=Marinisporobacter balticus TaxID=2018667 RepID=A0A4R2KPI1_9FIRM|nr:hypothetical protein [Marinisporobacter balticus]TCO74537.1 hypothetical protein EV214_11212 [Marinisporobacter balticus]
MFNDFYPNYYSMMPMYPPMPSMPSKTQPPEPMPAPPINQLPPNFEIEPRLPVQDDINYTQGYLRTHIGEYVKVEFLIGTTMLVDREGTLVDVGISYIVLQEPQTDDYLMCDIYSIKFVQIFK